MALVQANGVSLHVQWLGQGKPVAMLHGVLVGSLAAWYLTAAPSLARTHRVLLYDLRGHGRSEQARTGYDLATQSADLAALTDPVTEPLTLVGHSYGALISVRFALDHPDRVARLALVEAPLPPAEMSEFEAFMSRDPEQMLEALPRPVRDYVAAGGRRARRMLEKLRFLAFESSLFDELARQSFDDSELGRITCPVLCVYGDRSACRPAGDRLAAAIPGARLEVLAGGHYLHLEAPQELTSLLLEFVRG
jgi:pimeloyl-ACP methyl ester carboxylesterase